MIATYLATSIFKRISSSAAAQLDVADIAVPTAAARIVIFFTARFPTLSQQGYRKINGDAHAIAPAPDHVYDGSMAPRQAHRGSQVRYSVCERGGRVKRDIDSHVTTSVTSSPCHPIGKCWRASSSASRSIMRRLAFCVLRIKARAHRELITVVARPGPACS